MGWGLFVRVLFAYFSWGLCKVLYKKQFWVRVTVIFSFSASKSSLFFLARQQIFGIILDGIQVDV